MLHEKQLQLSLRRCCTWALVSYPLVDRGWGLNIGEAYKLVNKFIFVIEPNLTTLLRLLQAYIYNNGE